MDMNAPHVGFVIAAYVITGVMIGLVIWSTLRNAKRRQAELQKLEAEAARRQKP
jgi:heme exporter protein CcmD